jgi:hypothetical protein
VLILSAAVLFAVKFIPNDFLQISVCSILIFFGLLLFLKEKLQRIILKITGRFFIVIFAILLLSWLLLQTEMAQNFIVKKATAVFSKKLNTEVSIGHVSFSLFDKMNFEQVLVRDKQKDTLLYAGALKVRITDWFFLKDTAVLSYIGLENADIKLQRKDSSWNYQFIADYFSSPKKTKDTSAGLQFNLKKIDLKNVSIVQNDIWHGQRLTIKIGSLLLDANNIDLSNGIIDANEVDIDKPYFAIDNFDEIDKNMHVKKPASKDTGLYFNAGNLFAKANIIKITNGTFISEDDSEKHVNSYFDGDHLMFGKINATFNKFSFIKDTIKAKIEIGTTERSGFELKKLSAHFKLTPQIMEFTKMDLRTAKSRLGDYYAMKFKDFNHDINYYVEKIVMDARFKNSVVNSDDIAFFAPDLKTWKKQFELSGKFAGTVEDFKVNDLLLRAGTTMYANGNLAMKGLPHIDNTNINFTSGTFQASYGDMIAIVPSLKGIKNPDIAALGNLRFAGTFTGTIHDFLVNGNISTAIGGVYANVAMKLPSTGEPSYKGSITTNQFNLGKFVDADMIGLVSFDGKVDGSSFNMDRLKTSLDGTFNSFEFNNYVYSGLTFDGSLANKYFTGAFKASDPNFDFTSNIVIDLRGDEPVFNLLGDLDKANFRALNFTKDSVRLTGLFDLDFKGKNIDEFTGDAKILNATLIHDTTRLDFDSLAINSYYDKEDKKILTIESNQFKAKLSGEYSLLDLPNSFQAFLSHYFPSYIHPPAITPANQDFTVSFNTLDFTKYAQVLDSRLSGLNNSEITGSINTKDSGKFSFLTKIPFIKYDTYKLENAVIKGHGDFSSLTLDGNVDKIYVGDSTFFPNTKLSIKSQDDHSLVNISTSANNTLNDAELNADVYTVPDGVRIDFDPSSFVINDKKWDLEKEGELVIRKSFTSAKNVKFSQGFQEITVETEEEANSKNNLVVKLKDINLGDFMPLITKSPRLEGLANGSVYMRDFYGPFTIDADVKVDQLRMDDDSIGVIEAKASFDSKTGKISYGAVSDNYKYKFSADGSYNIKDSVNGAFGTTFHLNGAKIGIVNEFVGSIFADVKGEAYGDLTIKGNPAAPDLLGKITLRHGSLIVKYTKVHYTIDSAFFDFEDGVMDFGEFQIHDDLKNTATVRGKLYENEFKDMRYDFSMNTNKLLMINTTPKDNQQFYGRAIGKGSMNLFGPQNNMQMSITAESNDTSHIFIPTTTSKESADADFIVFKQYGTEMKQLKKTDDDDDTKLNIDLDLTATDKTQIDVILDELTGDVIKATGHGRLQIKVPSSGNMTMSGRYNIDHGNYDFNFQSFIRKPFELLPDAGNYIEWNGDPYKANIHVDAQYTAERVSLNDLISSQSASFNGTTKGYRGDVYVIAQLSGNLNQPSIAFRLDFPLGSPVKTDYEFSNLIYNVLPSNPNEMLKQVTYLIVVGTFAPYGEFSPGSTSATSLSVNTISQKLTGELNKLFSNVLYKITGDKSLQFDVGASTYSSTTLLDNNGISTNTTNNKLDRQSVNLKLNKSILNGKVIFTFGGDLDFGLTSAAVQSGNFQWLPDISVQVMLSKDRKLRAIIFNKSSLDVNVANAALGRTTMQGVSLSYTKDFEHLFKPKNPAKIGVDSTKAHP